MKVLLVVGMAAVLAGCASSSANMRVGTEQSLVSLKDQREATLAVREAATVPHGAVVVGKVDASRCHRNALHEPPTREALMGDLRAVAYARGADGIAELEETRESGLMQNCWNIVTLRATAFRTR